MKNSLKTFCAVTLLCVTALLLGSCGGKRAQVEKGVEALNRECPMDMGESGTLESIKLEGNDVVYYYAYANDLPMEIEALRRNPDAMKSMAKANFSSPGEELTKFVDLLIGAGMGVRYVFYKEDAPEVTAECGLTVDELKDLTENGLTGTEASLQKLQEVVNITNLSCPMRLDEYTVMRSMTLEPENVVYDYYVNEEQIPMSSIDREILKQENFSALDVSDMGVRMLLQLCVDCDRGLAYRYTGDKSGETIVVGATSSELAARLNTAE